MFYGDEYFLFLLISKLFFENPRKINCKLVLNYESDYNELMKERLILSK